MRGTRGALFGAVSIVFGLGIGDTACNGEDAGDPSDASSDVPLAEAGARADTEAENEAAPADRVPPRMITDLVATTESHSAVRLTWTAPSDDPGGKVTAYELRYAKSPIRTAGEFASATTAQAPGPGNGGAIQTTTVTGLDPRTEYHFAVRARDGAGNVAPLSNDAFATTKSRARLVITEVGVANSFTNGYDFVELIAKEGGSAEGIEIKDASTTLYRLSAIELAEGARLVVHTSGLPPPPGGMQEDKTRSPLSSSASFATAEAFDLYSASMDINVADATISVIDGPEMVDALALSNRDGDASPASMAAFAVFRANGAWAFTAAPLDDVNDCETQRDAVNISPSAAPDSACGRFATNYNSTLSINRDGLNDTNSKADFYVAPQTMGRANAPIPAPRVAYTTATSTTSATITFDQEIAAASVAATTFSVPGLTINSITRSNVHQVTLATTVQSDRAYEVQLGGTLTNLQGVSLAGALPRFCGFNPGGSAALILNEVHPNIDSQRDLVELLVTRGGSLDGYRLVRDPPNLAAPGVELAVLPAICAAVGDLVVVHLNPMDTDAFDSETRTKSEYPTAFYPSNYDSAWDVVGSNVIPFTNVVIALRNTANAYLDAVAIGRAAPSSGTYIMSLAFAQAMGLWSPLDCGGAQCNDVSTPTAMAVSASMVGVGTTVAGSSLRRVGATSSAASWVVGPSSFGALNP